MSAVSGLILVGTNMKIIWLSQASSITLTKRKRRHFPTTDNISKYTQGLYVPFKHKLTEGAEERGMIYVYQ